MCYFGFGFSESPERVGINLINHERDWIYLTKDLGINMSLEEFDSLTRKRISRIIHIQEKKIEQENEIKKKGEDITIKLKGGDLVINYTDDTVYMTGDAEKVFDGTVEI